MPCFLIDAGDPLECRLPCCTRAPEPWHTLHVDFVVPVVGCTILVVMNSHTMWLQVQQVAHPISTTVIGVRRSPMRCLVFGGR